MTEREVIADASPLISLDRAGHLKLMVQLFGIVTIPLAVADEVGPSIASQSWVRVRAVARPLDPRIMHSGLGPGEIEAIGLALERQPVNVVLDDESARKLAQSLGLPVIGTLGLLLAAKRRLLIPTIRPILDALLATGYRLSPQLYEEAVRQTGEADREAGRG